MTDYQPTDEQIEALAKADAYISGADEIEWDNGTGVGAKLWMTDTRALTEHPAFQSIVRAAQAEVLRELADGLKHPPLPYAVWASGAGEVLRKRADEIEAADV